MIRPQWIFKKKQPDDTTRDPISGEFFSTEAIRNSAEALVREGIQNSLDAARDGLKVQVYIRLSGDAGAVLPSKFAPFFAGLFEHLGAPKNGLSDDHRPTRDRACRFLTFEDFGTRGLEGDPLQWHKVEAERNGFFAFFRAEGESDKSATDRRGRWGVGKFVFPRASVGSTFFGLTVRASDARVLLMGRSILKSHRLGDSYYTPDGYFGVGRELSGGRLIAPVEDGSLITAFRSAFGLMRQSEPGLSLVVPWHDEEITRERLLEAAIRDWFFSVLAGELEIFVSDPSGCVELTRSTFEKCVSQMPDDTRREMEPLVALARFALGDEGKHHAILPAADTSGAPKWHEAMLAPEQLQHLRQRLDAERAVAVRIPIRVRPKKAPAADSHLDVFIQRDPAADDGRPVFVREGIIVSDAKGGRARGFRSLVVCDDKPLADLLGDAENPSHTEWRPDTANFKDRYTYGPGYLTFVRECVRQLVTRLHENDADDAPELLVDLFSLPKEVDLGKKAPAPARKPGEKTEPPPPLPPPAPARYRISRVAGGFTLGRGDPQAVSPAKLEVKVAYDVRRGSPFRKYDPADFQLLKDDIRLDGDPRGLEIESCADNRLELAVKATDFHLTVVGFDVNRDVIVNVTAKGELDGHAPD